MKEKLDTHRTKMKIKMNNLMKNMMKISLVSKRYLMKMLRMTKMIMLLRAVLMNTSRTIRSI